MTPPHQPFGDRVRALRIDKGLTIAVVAQALGMSTSYVSEVERGRRNPWSPDVVRRLATVLGADAGDLLRSARATRGVLLRGTASNLHAQTAWALWQAWELMPPDALRDIRDIATRTHVVLEVPDEPR